MPEVALLESNRQVGDAIMPTPEHLLISSAPYCTLTVIVGPLPLIIAPGHRMA
jgi:hypothetical protein